VKDKGTEETEKLKKKQDEFQQTGGEAEEGEFEKGKGEGVGVEGQTKRRQKVRVGSKTKTGSPTFEQKKRRKKSELTEGPRQKSDRTVKTRRNLRKLKGTHPIPGKKKVRHERRPPGGEPLGDAGAEHETGGPVIQ